MKHFAFSRPCEGSTEPRMLLYVGKLFSVGMLFSVDRLFSRAILCLGVTVAIL